MNSSKIQIFPCVSAEFAFFYLAFSDLTLSCGARPLEGTALLAPYTRLAPLQQKRLAARRHKTTYAYDFPSVFGNALRLAWAARAAAGEPDAVPPPGEHVISPSL